MPLNACTYGRTFAHQDSAAAGQDFAAEQWSLYLFSK